MIRSLAVRKTIIPSTANRVSGKTSEVAYPARVAMSSWFDPGVEAPIGVNASPPTPPKRSPMMSTLITASSSRAPMRNTETPSTTTEPPRVTAWLVARPDQQGRERAEQHDGGQRRPGCRAGTGAARTPRRARRRARPATTTSIGAIAA